jgi:glycerol-3-phosphate acyltransferase PlsY
VERLFAVVLAYLVGSLDFGVIVPRLMGIDIYSRGSGNPGTSNVFRTLGKRAAAIVLIGDATKGAIAAAIGTLWIGETFGFVTAFVAVIGHILPVWHGFRGGRGVATAIGAAIYLEPVVGLIIAVVWTVIVLVWKVASIASLVAMAIYVPGFALSGHDTAELLWATAIAGAVVLRHAPNIRRMFQGAESKVQES